MARLRAPDLRCHRTTLNPGESLQLRAPERVEPLTFGSVDRGLRAMMWLYEIRLAALFLDAVFLSVRPEGPKEGVLVAWGFTESDEGVLVVADGAPGLIKAVEQCWPASDRQHCAVHRVRNLLAKLPERERERVR